MKKKQPNLVNSRLDNVPEIKIKGDIGRYDGTWISEQINRAYNPESGKPAKKIRIIINSFGGYIDEAFEIISAMQLFMNAGGIIETVNVGVADSAAGWIASNGSRGYRKVMQFASGFFHPPILEDGTRISDLPEGDPTREAMQNTFDKLIDIFTGNTGRTKSSIVSIMEAETDMNADQLVKNGFADEKVVVDNAPKLKNTLSRVEIFNTTESLNFEINKPNAANHLNSNNMKNLANLLNLNPEASTDAVSGEVKKLLNAKQKAESDLAAVNAKFDQIKAERDSLKGKLDTLENKQIEEYVDEVIKNDASKKDQRDSLVNMAKNDFETFKNIVPLKKAIVNGAKIDDGINEQGQDAELAQAKEFMNMSHEKRTELKNSDYDKFKTLAAAYDKHFAQIQ